MCESCQQDIKKSEKLLSESLTYAKNNMDFSQVSINMIRDKMLENMNQEEKEFLFSNHFIPLWIKANTNDNPFSSSSLETFLMFLMNDLDNIFEEEEKTININSDKDISFV